MTKFRKMPVIVEAIQYKNNMEEIGLFLNECVVYDKNDMAILIDTLEGEMRCNIGDYIIKGIKGEFYPCREDIFNLTYEEYKE